ncbi:MAG: thioredoxin [Deltaproteobacteria bacterium]|nr:thioredoxin [Deltaproteobacteria bacterium]
MLVNVDKENYEQEILRSDLPVLVDFWGPQCQPCLALMPYVEALASERKESLKVAKVDASKNRRLCLNLKVLGLPTFLLYRNGEEVGRISGNNITPDSLIQWIDKNTG